jgi:hypothetical protein
MPSVPCTLLLPLPEYTLEHLFDTAALDRQPVEMWRGELEGLHIRHDGDPIPVTVRVQWTDGTEGEVSGWTSQRTKSHVCVVREIAPPYQPFWVRSEHVRRR